LVRPKILIPGSTIFYRDDMARELFFIESGEVEVSLLLPTYSPPYEGTDARITMSRDLQDGGSHRSD
jgi:hypothetical protein